MCCYSASTNIYSDGSVGKTEILGGLDQMAVKTSPGTSYDSSSSMPLENAGTTLLTDGACYAIASMLASPEYIERTKARTAELREQTAKIIQEREEFERQTQTKNICWQIENTYGLANRCETGVEAPNKGLIQRLCNLLGGKKSLSIPKEIDVLIGNLENITNQQRVHFLVSKSSDRLFSQSRQIFGEKFGEPKEMASYQPLLAAIINNPKYKPFVTHVLAVIPAQYHQGLLNIVENYNDKNAYMLKVTSVRER